MSNKVPSIHALIRQAQMHADEFEDVRPVSCELLRALAEQLELLQEIRENQATMIARLKAELVARAANSLAVPTSPTAATDAQRRP